MTTPREILVTHDDQPLAALRRRHDERLVRLACHGILGQEADPADVSACLAHLAAGDFNHVELLAEMRRQLHPDAGRAGDFLRALAPGVPVADSAGSEHLSAPAQLVFARLCRAAHANRTP